MGCYINPPDMTKEAFLSTHGTLTATPTITDTHLPVCWVHNAPFTAAAIAYCAEEIEAFSDPDDRRAKRWFQVPRTALAPYYHE